MTALNFPRSTRPADLAGDAKRAGQGSGSRKMTKGAGRVWGFIVAPLVVWAVIFLAGSWVFDLFWTAAK